VSAPLQAAQLVIIIIIIIIISDKQKLKIFF